MQFNQAYLTDLVNAKTRGDFPPFSSGQWEDVDVYLKQVVGRLKDIKSLVLKADFDDYGSGFSSYVHLYLSKKDKSDVTVTVNGNLTTEATDGLMIYLCRLAPFAVYAPGNWYTTHQEGKWHSGGSHYIEASEVGQLPELDWQEELTLIKNTLQQFGISFLTEATLNRKLDFKINIPTILSDPPFHIFDCLFYWAD